MIFSKKIIVILSDDFNLAALQRKFQFRVEKITISGFDLIHQLSFEKNQSPSYVQLFSNQLTQIQTFYSLVSPVHIHVGINGLSLTKVLVLPEKISYPFLERLALEFGIQIKILPNHFWAINNSNANFSIASSSDSVYSYVHDLINHTHDDQNLNEIQMFIRSDPIYEQSKIYTGENINSLWFWGGQVKQTKTKKQTIKFKPRFNKTFGHHPYFSALNSVFKIENQIILSEKLIDNQLKSNNLMICTRENQNLLEEMIQKHKKNVTLYYRNHKLETR